MTIENCIKLLKAYKKQADNPTNPNGLPLTGDERIHVQEQSNLNYENMKNHILKCKKFQNHPIISELQNKPIEEVKNGKKPKR